MRLAGQRFSLGDYLSIFGLVLLFGLVFLIICFLLNIFNLQLQLLKTFQYNFSSQLATFQSCMMQIRITKCEIAEKTLLNIFFNDKFTHAICQLFFSIKYFANMLRI